jgi:hypothetical protein
MADHPFVEATRRTSQAEDQLVWAAEAGARIDALVTEALACADAERARALLGAAIRGLYQHALPYRGVSPAEQWLEQTHRKLHAKAREVFGADAWKVVPPLAVEPLPMPGAGAGPPSMFGR